MGNVVVYTGQAGTGKTYSLMQLLTKIIPQRQWSKFETVLALTFMHGSRKRLESNLKFIKSDFKIRCECSTIDSFALTLVNRFRSYLNISKTIKPSEITSENDLEFFMDRNMIREKAANILRFDSVKKFVSNSYPYIIIDEFQDCVGDLLEIIKQLSNSTNILIASDQFQQLLDPENLEGMQWITENQFQHIDLNSGGVKRTKNSKILLTATCLRTGVLSVGPKISIYPCPGGKGGTFGLAEYQLKANIHYNLAHGNIAIISPTQNGSFVTSLLSSLSKSYTYKKEPFNTIGPYNQLLGTDNHIDIVEMIRELPKEPLTKDILRELKRKNEFILNRVADKLLKRLSMRNLEMISYEEFQYTLQQIAHTYDNFYRKENKAKIVFTTIHGAKNREFDNVIILWPYVAPNDLLQKRKLLYNAITRAKRNAVIIVQYKSNDVQDLAKDDLFSLIIDKKAI